MSNLIPYAALSGVLQRCGFPQDAAEYHGALCGALCARAPAAIDPTSVLERDAELDDADAVASLTSLRDDEAARLADATGGFTPLLPDDERPLSLRAGAFGSWCEGFLFGLASSAGLQLNKVSAELREVLDDLTQFTKVSHDAVNDAEMEEEAYAELVEYLRVGVQLVFVELTPRRADAAGSHQSALKH